MKLQPVKTWARFFLTHTVYLNIVLLRTINNIFIAKYILYQKDGPEERESVEPPL